jgi:hypothetical protein
MGKADYWRDGAWNARCDQSGEKIKSNDDQLEWDGLRVRPQSLDPRHPQDLIRPPKEQTWLPWTRPDPAPIWLVNPTTDSHLIDGFMIDSEIIG